MGYAFLTKRQPATLGPRLPAELSRLKLGGCCNSTFFFLLQASETLPEVYTPVEELVVGSSPLRQELS